MIDNLNKFNNSREEVINFFRNFIKLQNKMKIREQDLKFHHQNKYFKDCHQKIY